MSACNSFNSSRTDGAVGVRETVRATGVRNEGVENEGVSPSGRLAGVVGVRVVSGVRNVCQERIGVSSTGAPIFSTVDSAGGGQIPTRRVGDPEPKTAGDPSFLCAITGVDQMLRTRLVGDVLRRLGDPAPNGVGESFVGEAGFARKRNFGVERTEP